MRAFVGVTILIGTVSCAGLLWAGFACGVGVPRPALLVQRQEGRSPYALALYGGVSHLAKFGKLEDRPENVGRINVSLVAELYREFISPDMDVFIHSWSRDHSRILTRLYCPVKAVFEDNAIYRDLIESKRREIKASTRAFSQVSMSLSWSKVLTMVTEHQKSTGHVYKAVVLIRPDLVLRKQIMLDLPFEASRKHGARVFSTWGNKGNSDFHFVMNGESADVFRMIFSDINKSTLNVVAHSGWIRTLLGLRGLALLPGDVIAGKHEEVYRVALMAKRAGAWHDWLRSRLPPQCAEVLLKEQSNWSAGCGIDLSGSGVPTCMRISI